MKNGFLSGLFGFISIAAWIVSCFLTVNFMLQVFSMSPVWMVAGFMMGVIADSAKLGTIISYIKHRHNFAMALAIGLVTLSVAATFGALQSYLEKGAIHSVEYTEKQNTLTTLDNQIADLEATAEKQREINHITRSKKTLSEITPLITERDAIARELKEIQVNASGVSGAIFRAFANLFKLNIYYVSIFGNVFIAILLELISIYSYVFLTKFKNAEAKTSTPKKDKSKKDDGGQDELSTLRLINGPDGLQLVNDKGEVMPFTVDTNGGHSQGENPEPVNDPRPIGFELTDRSPIPIENVNPVNENLPVNVNENLPKNLIKIIRNQGKSDAAILEVYDNWPNYSNDRLSYGNISKVLKNAGIQASKTYCFRIVKRERLGGEL